MARIASGIYDAVIVSHRSFEFLPVSDQLFNRFMGEQLQQLEVAIVEAREGQGADRATSRAPHQRTRLRGRDSQSRLIT